MNFLESYKSEPAIDKFMDQCTEFRKIRPELNYRSPFLENKRNPGPERIGIVSVHMGKLCSVFLTTSGLVFNRPEIVIISDKNFFNYKNFKKLSGNFEKDKKLIEDQEFDIILYPDIHLCEYTDVLAMCRLGRVQATTWGHSDTSGMDSIDYYISSTMYETDDAQKYYSECLVRTNCMNVFYPKPELTRKVCIGEPYMVLASSKFKMNSDTMIMTKRVQELTRTLLVVTGHADLEILDKYNLNYKVFPKSELPMFLALLSGAELVLDSYPFGNCNIALQALGMGARVVTLPSNRLFGRFTQGFYNKMGYTDLIATSRDDYIMKCVQVIRDRNLGRKEISDNNWKLFEDAQSLTNFDTIFKKISGKFEIIHFVYGLSKSEEMCFVHFMSMWSAIYHNRPQNVMFWYHYEPTGPLWDIIKPHLTLKRVETNHRTELIRLGALYEFGGIYFDIDTISTQPLDVSPGGVTIGSQKGLGGLCSSVIASIPRSQFILKWIQLYDSFKDGDPTTLDLTNVTIRDNWHGVRRSECEKVMFDTPNLEPTHPVYHLYETTYYDRLRSITPQNVSGLYKKCIPKMFIDEFKMAWKPDGDLMGYASPQEGVIFSPGGCTMPVIINSCPEPVKNLPLREEPLPVIESGADMPTGTETLTWIVSVYNRPELVQETIESIKKQTVPCKYIICDDGSDTPIPGATVRNERNMGYTYCRRKLNDMCDTNIVAVVDSDDILHPDATKEILNVFMVSKCVMTISGTFVPGLELINDQYEHIRAWRKSCLPDTAFGLDVQYAEDRDLFYRMEELGNIIRIEKDLIQIRKFADSITSQKLGLCRRDHCTAKLLAMSRRAVVQNNIHI